MGRRSRKRAVPAAGDRRSAHATATTPAPPPATRGPRRRARMEEAPKAPWSPFPLVELVVLLALVLLVAGALSEGGRRAALVACGIGLACLAGLELAIREHFAGFRSHSTLLAFAAGVAVVTPLVLLAGLPQVAVAIAGGVAYWLAFVALRRTFKRRSGGLGYRV